MTLTGRSLPKGRPHAAFGRHLGDSPLISGSASVAMVRRRRRMPLKGYPMPSVFRLSLACLAVATFPPGLALAGPDTSNGKAARSEKPTSEPTRFVRIVRDAAGKPVSFETCTARYVPAADSPAPADLVVDLVAVTHVGEREYFAGLDGQLKDYDAVLYELVAPKGVVPQPGAEGGTIPALLKSSLDLEYQTERIDYTRPNFVHADLTPRQIGEKMRQRGQTGLSVALDALGNAFAEATRRAARGEEGSELSSLSLATLLLDPNGQVKLKRAFAAELERAELGGALGQAAEQMLVTDRNEAALAVLKDQIAAGRRRIAIFYGAGHMPDLERRLAEDFGLERQGVQWREAWDLSEKPAKPAKPARK